MVASSTSSDDAVPRRRQPTPEPQEQPKTLPSTSGIGSNALSSCKIRFVSMSPGPELFALRHQASECSNRSVERGGTQEKSWLLT